MQAKWIIEESTNISKIINKSENLILEYVDEIIYKNQIKAQAKFDDLLKTNMLKLIELFFNLKNFNLDSKKIDSEIDALNNIISITSKLHFEDSYSTILNSLRDSYRNGESHKNNDDKFLIHFTDNCDFWIFSWSEKEDLYKILDEILEDYSTETFFDSKQNFTPEVIFDNEILSFLKYMNIDLKKIIKDKHNEEYLESYWEIEFQIKATVENDFIDHKDEIDHAAYHVMDIMGVRIEEDVVKYNGEIYDLWNGYEINPLSENLNELIQEKVEKHIDNNLYEIFNENDKIVKVFIEGNMMKPIIKNQYFPNSDKIIK